MWFLGTDFTIKQGDVYLYFCLDDCSSCVERSFKLRELVQKVCHEFDYGENIYFNFAIKLPAASIYYDNFIEW